MNEEDIGDSDLHYRLTDGASQTGEEIGHDNVGVVFDQSLINAASKLQGHAEKVNRPATISVEEGDEDQTAKC